MRRATFTRRGREQTFDQSGYPDAPMRVAPLEGGGSGPPQAFVPPRHGAPGSSPAALSVLAQRLRPGALAKEELLPALPAIAELVGTPGLRRGSTVVVEAAGAASGASALALALLGAPSAAGASAAIVGLPDLGLLAAQELGVALDRLVVVPQPAERAAAVVGAFLEGVDIVLARLPDGLPGALARRLAARARERRSVLVLAGRGVGEALVLPSATSRGPWPETPDARLVVTSSTWALPAEGEGLLARRSLRVDAFRRRAAPERLQRTLLLPAPPGGDPVWLMTQDGDGPSARASSPHAVSG